MRVYRMKYNDAVSGLIVEWFSSKNDARVRRGELRKENSITMAFEVDRFNAPTSREEMPKFLTNPEPYLDNETPLTLG